MAAAARKATFALLHLILFATPWSGDRGNPALLLDLPARRLFAFGSIFTAADTIILLLLLLFLAFSLFFFTSLFGRLWCGFACPQTVFLDDLDPAAGGVDRGRLGATPQAGQGGLEHRPAPGARQPSGRLTSRSRS